MPRKIDYESNGTQGVAYEILCVKCAGKTTHKVMVSVDVAGLEDDQDDNWNIDYQIIQCQGCKTISFRESSWNSYDVAIYGEETISVKVYPLRNDGIKGLGGDVYYLPSKVRDIYNETFLAFSSGLPILAAVGLRALIEAVCKEKKVAGALLHKFR